MCKCVIEWREDASVNGVHNKHPVLCEQLLDELRAENAALREQVSADSLRGLTYPGYWRGTGEYVPEPKPVMQDLGGLYG